MVFPEVQIGDGVSKLPIHPYVDGKEPAFSQNFEYIYLTPPPFSNSQETCIRGLVRHFGENDEGENDESCSPTSRLLGLLDAWYSPALPMLATPCPASSLTLTVDIVEDVPDIGEEFLQYEARIVHSKHGYATVAERLYTVEGQLLAISQQNVVHFG